VLGEVYMATLLDRGSTPLISTKRESVELYFVRNEFALVYRFESRA